MKRNYDGRYRSPSTDAARDRRYLRQAGAGLSYLKAIPPRSVPHRNRLKVSRMLRRPSPTTIIACLALFFSLAGTGIAASRYIITSTSQIKPSVRRALHGAEGARGPLGPQGVPGTTGPVGGEANLTNINIKIKYLEGRVTELEAHFNQLCISGIGWVLGDRGVIADEVLYEAFSTISHNCNA